MNRKTTKVQVLTGFRELFADELARLKNDVVAKREMWNNYTDALHKDKVISDMQYTGWTNPF